MNGDEANAPISIKAHCLSMLSTAYLKTGFTFNDYLIINNFNKKKRLSKFRKAFFYYIVFFIIILRLRM